MDSNGVWIGVTGSRGVLGRALLKNWSDGNEKVHFIPFKGNIENQSDVHQWLADMNKVDGLFHFAALVSPAEVDKDPLKAFRVNALRTLNLLESCRLRFSKETCPWIFIASSSHVYASSSDEQFVRETSPLSPVSTYGLTKAQGNAWAELYRNKYNLPICTARIFSYSAPDQPATFFIPSLIEKIRNAPPSAQLDIRGLDGTGDFLTVRQILQAIQWLFTRKAIGIYNIGTGRAVKLFDIAEAVRVKLARDDIQIISTGTDTHHLVANVQKLNDIGFTASFDMDTFLDSLFPNN